MTIDVTLILVALSSLAAVVSAIIAVPSHRDNARRGREDRVRELSLLANKVVAATVRVDDLANQLKLSYQTLFTFAGHGGGSSSRLKLYIGEIEKKQAAIGPMQAAAREVLDAGPATFADERISERVLELDGYLAALDRVREQYQAELASVEAQNQQYRARALDQ